MHFYAVVLDHGIYTSLDEEFRVNYCQLWKALILLDSHKIQQVGQHFGIGKYAKYLPLIFTGRTINRCFVLPFTFYFSAKYRKNISPFSHLMVLLLWRTVKLVLGTECRLKKKQIWNRKWNRLQLAIYQNLWNLYPHNF